MKINDLHLRSMLYVRDLTQTALAERIGVSRTTVAAICTGKSCKLATAKKIADALNVSLEEIAQAEAPREEEP